MTFPLRKIISGAQTGADQGGLEAAVVLGLDRGGWVPFGRRTEKGPLTDQQMEEWGLTEHPSSSYNGRTLKNVYESHGTALFGRETSAGSKLTISYCELYQRPYILNPTPEMLRVWVKGALIGTLNVAGNRESVNPGIQERVKALLIEAFRPEAG